LLDRAAASDQVRVFRQELICRNSWASITSCAMLASASCAPAVTSPCSAARRMMGRAAE